MRTILLISRNNSFLEKFSQKLGDADRYAVSTATDREEAAEALGGVQTDLVCLPLVDAAADDFALLELIDNEFHIPVLVCTDRVSDKDADRLDCLAAFNLAPTGIDPPALTEQIDLMFNKGAQGHISGVSLASFLQLVELDRKTCTLRIKHRHDTGVLYFREGELIDAVSGQLMGEEAALLIVGWAPVEIDIFEQCRKSETNIESPLGFILIEGARRKDEMRSMEAEERPPAPREEDTAGNESAPPQKAKVAKSTTQTHSPPPTDAPAGKEAPLPPARQAMLDHLIAALEDFRIDSLLITGPEGQTVCNRNFPTRLTPLAHATKTAALELAEALGCRPPRQIQLGVDGHNLLLLSGPRAMIAMEIGDGQSAAVISGNLERIIKRIDFS